MTSFITSLSTELIWQIIEFIPPESHFEFACTCKRLAGCSSDVLKLHQEAYSKFRVASDIAPTTIPTLLRSAFGRADPLLAWHVRSIKIWYDRTSWLDWGTVDFEHYSLKNDLDVADVSLWDNDEFSEYLNSFKDQFDAMPNSGGEEMLQEALTQFGDGLDGVLKMLLIASCPRLRDVKVIPLHHQTGSTLEWLKRVIQGSILQDSHWPLGLCHIRSVAVGVYSQTWRSTQHIHIPDGDNTLMHTFSALLRLPGLQSIYWNDLRRSNFDTTDYNSPALMPPRCSTVKRIFLDNCTDMPYNFRVALCQAPIALESFTLRAGTDSRLNPFYEADALVHDLCSSQSDSLTTLMFYGPFKEHEIYGYRCNVYRNEELSKARKLSLLAINVTDLEAACFYRTGAVDVDMEDHFYDAACDGTGACDVVIGYEQQHEFFVKWFCEEAFPQTLETLVLWGNPEEKRYMSESKSRFLGWLEDALMRAIESRRLGGASDGDKGNGVETVYYPHLKAIYLEDVETVRSGHGGWSVTPRSDKICFTRLIEVGKNAGVDIHTITNRTTTRQEIEFPVAPYKYDLQTGPWWKCRNEVEDWVLDVYKGVRRVPGCGKCGRCRVCLMRYSEELWKSLDD